MSNAIKLSQRIVRIFSVLGLMAALTMLLLPAHGAAAKTAGGGTLSIHAADLDTGANISNAYVLIVDEQTGWMDKGQTNDFGYLDLAVAIGSYTVKASASGYEDAKMSTSVKLGTETKVAVTMRSLSGGVPPAGAGARNIPGVGTLTVHATDLNTAAGLNGATVGVYADGDPIVMGKGVTDAQGDFSIDLAPGLYTIVLDATGYDLFKAPATVQVNATTQIKVALASNVAPAPSPKANPVTPGMGSMWLAMQDQSTRLPISDALVAVYDVYGAVAAKGLSTASGVFMTSLPMGSYVVQVSASGYEDVKLDMQVSGDPTAPQNVLLLPLVAPAPFPVPGF